LAFKNIKELESVMNHRLFASLWTNLSKRLRSDHYLKGWCWFKFSGKLNWEGVRLPHADSLTAPAAEV